MLAEERKRGERATEYENNKHNYHYSVCYSVDFFPIFLPPFSSPLVRHIHSSAVRGERSKSSFDLIKTRRGFARAAADLALHRAPLQYDGRFLFRSLPPSPLIALKMVDILPSAARRPFHLLFECLALRRSRRTALHSKCARVPCSHGALKHRPTHKHSHSVCTCSAPRNILRKGRRIAKAE